MSETSATYVSQSGRQLSFSHDRARVVGVVEGAEQRTLPAADSRWWSQTTAWPQGGPFEWGYEGAWRLHVAGTILTHRLGFQPAGVVALAFSDDVISRLPQEFELDVRQVDEWISEHLVSGCLSQAAG